MIRRPARSALFPYPALFRSLDGGLAVVGGVGPVAGGIEGEGAVSVGACGCGLGGEIGLALVDVGDGEGAAGGEIAGNNRNVFGDRTGGGAGDQRHVIGAVDGDGDALAGGAARGDGGEAVRAGIAGAELLDGGLAVVGGVGPVAGGIEGEGAGSVGAWGCGLGGEIGLVRKSGGEG